MKVQDLTELFEIQARLDFIISVKHPVQHGENRTQKKYAALLVELGEAMNEWRAFKFWSTDQKPRTEKLLEELVDCLHFILSIGLELHVENMLIPAPFIYEQDVEGTFIRLQRMNWIKDYERAFDLFMGFCQLLDFSPEELKAAYLKKNEINIQRQEEGY
jgi:dimeric dUTPase (all-alpha-NTP-PPase superfamily)